MQASHHVLCVSLLKYSFCKSGAGVCGSSTVCVGSLTQEHTVCIVCEGKQLGSSSATKSLSPMDRNWKGTEHYN